MMQKTPAYFPLARTIVIQLTYMLTYNYKRRQVCLANNMFARTGDSMSNLQLIHSQITAVCCVIIEVTKRTFKANSSFFIIIFKD